LLRNSGPVWSEIYRGEGVGYSDNESVNLGNAKDYRSDDGVDLFSSNYASNNIVVGNVRPEEWLNYSFTVEKSGAYFLSIIASNTIYNRAAIDVFIDKDLTLENQFIPTTGDWDNFKETVSDKSFVIDSGKHTLKIVVKNDDFHLDKIKIQKDFQYTGHSDGFLSKPQIHYNSNNKTIAIHIDTQLPSYFSICDLNGLKLKEGFFINNSTISLNSNVQGIYFLSIISGKKRFTKR